jgi:hypothetical protein
VLVGFHIGYERGKEQLFGTHVEAERFAQAQVRHQLGL